MSALILGFFASSWFGWAQEKPPAMWRGYLLAGAVTSLLVAAVGGARAWQLWQDGSALSEPGAMRRYGIVVGIEIAVSAIGSIPIAVLGKPEFLPPWICLVVGVHMWPMVSVFHAPALLALGIALTAVALLAVPIARGADIASSAVTGAAAGVILLVFAGWCAVSTVS